MPRVRVIMFMLSLHSVTGRAQATECLLTDLMAWCAHASNREHFPSA